MEEVARVPLSSVWGHKMRRTATKLKPDKKQSFFHILSYYPVGHRAPGSQDQGRNEIQKGSGHLCGYQEYPAITVNANKENLERIWKRSWAFGWKPLSNYKGLGWSKVWGWQRQSVYLPAKGCHVLPHEAGRTGHCRALGQTSDCTGKPHSLSGLFPSSQLQIPPSSPALVL